MIDIEVMEALAFIADKVTSGNVAFLPLCGGPFDGAFHPIPCDSSPDGMLLKKGRRDESSPSIYITAQSIYKLVGFKLIYQGDEQYDRSRKER